MSSDRFSTFIQEKEYENGVTLISAAFIRKNSFLRGMDQKRRMKRPPPTPEEALLDTLHERLDALPHMEELPADLDVDLLGIYVHLIRIYMNLRNGEALRREDLEEVTAEISALEACVKNTGVCRNG